MFHSSDSPIGLRRNSTIPAAPVEGFHVLNTDTLIHPKETPMFWVCAVISIFMYLLAVSLVWYLIPVFLILGLVSHGLLLGHLRGNGVRVSVSQFPEVHHIVHAFSEKLGLEPPPVYIIESGGLLNAFAARLLRRNYVVLYSNIVELAYEHGQDALEFVVAHELAHIKRKHLQNRWLVNPASLLPTVNAYYRACEYTCDAIAAHLSPKGALDGLMVLATGTKLYRRMSPLTFIQQAKTERGFWTWYNEYLSTHPHLSKRLEAVQKFPVVQKALSTELATESAPLSQLAG